MKRKIFAFAKSVGATITRYHSYRSDMGCQCYEISFTYKGKTVHHDDGYFVGEEGGAEKVFKFFTQLF